MSTEKEAREIDAILAKASRPQVPAGAHERLLARLPSRTPSNVVLLAPRRPAWRVWPAVAALAASFAFGILLGAEGTVDGLWPQPSDDEASVVGLGEVSELVDGDST